MGKEMEIYVHIPFCVRKCAYCDFLSGPANKETIDNYVEALMNEIRGVPKWNTPLSLFDNVTSVFIGGGTPSILEGAQIEKLLQTLREKFNIDANAEITIEINPGTVQRDKLKCYKKAGINRISFGLQSTNDDELKLLGRIHTYEEFLESYKMARECGFDNINVDLISAIPNQSILSWEMSLRKIVELEPEHISAYSLIVEEGTPFAEQYGEGTPKHYELPTEEEERQMYRRTETILNDAGFHRYEISNYAKEGKECKHNLGYWERKNYLGLGLGASSLIENVRFKNIDDIKIYMEKSHNPSETKEYVEELTKKEQMEEFVFLGLRKMQGISLVTFESIFGKMLMEVYGENIERMQKEQLLEIENEYLKLTQRGIDISNYVIAEILG